MFFLSALFLILTWLGVSFCLWYGGVDPWRENHSPNKIIVGLKALLFIVPMIISAESPMLKVHLFFVTLNFSLLFMPLINSTAHHPQFGNSFPKRLRLSVGGTVIITFLLFILSWLFSAFGSYIWIGIVVSLSILITITKPFAPYQVKNRHNSIGNAVLACLIIIAYVVLIGTNHTEQHELKPDDFMAYTGVLLGGAISIFDA